MKAKIFYHSIVISIADGIFQSFCYMSKNYIKQFLDNSPHYFHSKTFYSIFLTIFGEIIRHSSCLSLACYIKGTVSDDNKKTETLTHDTGDFEDNDMLDLSGYCQQ